MLSIFGGKGKLISLSNVRGQLLEATREKSLSSFWVFPNCNEKKQSHESTPRLLDFAVGNEIIEGCGLETYFLSLNFPLRLHSAFFNRLISKYTILILPVENVSPSFFRSQEVKKSNSFKLYSLYIYHLKFSIFTIHNMSSFTKILHLWCRGCLLHSLIEKQQFFGWWPWWRSLLIKNYIYDVYHWFVFCVHVSNSTAVYTQWN